MAVGYERDIKFDLNAGCPLISVVSSTCRASRQIRTRLETRTAIGRKNWLLVGLERGGQAAAVLFSFTSTCQRLGVEPWTYLEDVLICLPTTPADQLTDLLPDRWQAARSAHTSNLATVSS